MKDGNSITVANKAILICGDPGTRKTTLALHFPSPYFFDCDNNLAAPVEQTGIRSFFYDSAARKDDGTYIHPLDRFIHCVTCINAAVAHPDIKTIVIDSLTTFSDILLAEVRRQEFGSMAVTDDAKDAADNKTLRIQDWGKFGQLLKNFFTKFRTCGKTIVVIAHNIIEKDEADNRYKIFLNIPGQSKVYFSGLFTDTWFTQCEVSGVGPAKKHEFIVRSLPLHDYDHRGAKSSLVGIRPRMLHEDVIKVLKKLQ